jgi:multidrug efflux system outer membrane protein
MKKIPLAALLALAAFAPVGCTVGPDFHEPEQAVPAQWLGTGGAGEGARSVATPETIAIQKWWTTFNDPQLDGVVARAVQSNFDVRLATSRIRQARASRGVVAAGFFPSAAVSGSYRRSFTGGSHQPSSGVDLFQAALDAVWEVDIFGGIRRDIEASEADIQAAVEDRRDVMVTLASEVALNYIDLRGLQQELAIASGNLESQRRSADLTRQLQKGGFVGALDVANADALVATTLAQLPVIQTSLQQAIFNLGLLLGREPGALQAELAPVADVPPVPPTVPVGLPSELLRRRPDIRRAEAQLHAATARVGVATSDLFPKISLTGSLGLNSTQLTSLTNWASRFWAIGPTVSWPIFDAGRITANIEAQTEAEKQALLTYGKTVFTAMNEVENALVAYNQEQLRHKALQDAVAANRKAVDISTRLYKEGQTDFLNVLEAQRSLFGSEDALVRSTRDIATDLVAIYKALGGGWYDIPETDPTTPATKP